MKGEGSRNIVIAALKRLSDGNHKKLCRFDHA